MMRTTSLDNYDKWTTGALPFTDPIVKNAFQKFSDIWLNDKYVYGGRKTVATTDFGDAGTPCSRTRRSAGCSTRATSSPPSWRRTRPA